MVSNCLPLLCLDDAKNGCLQRNDFPQNQARPLSKHDDRCFLIDATLLKAKDISETNICSISIIQWEIEWWKR